MRCLTRLGMCILMFMSFLTSKAFDFEVDGLYYNVVSSTDLTVELVGFSPEWDNPVVDLPSIITVNNKTLTVVSMMGYSSYKPPKQIIKKVSFPNTMKIIADLFNECPNLEYIDIPEGVEVIGGYAFSGCENLLEITIPSTINYLGSGAFYGCKNLKRINIQNISSWLAIDNKGSALFSGEGNIYVNGEVIYNLSIPDDVVRISDYAFMGWTNLQTVSIPKSVTYIGEYVFVGCKGLNKIIIEDSDTPLYFENGYTYGWTSNGILVSCEHLDNLYLGRNLEYSTLSGCKTPFEKSSIKHVEIGENVTTIPIKCFFNCGFLNDINIPKNVTELEDGALGYCPLDNLSIDDADTEINIGYCSPDRWDDMFKYSNTTHLYLGRNVSGKGSGFKQSMYNLETIEFGHSINPIPSFISDSHKLNSIMIHRAVPPEYDYAWGFSDAAYAKVVLCVPLGSKEKYLSHPIWKNFWNIEECLQEENGSDSISNINALDSKFKVFDINGILIKDECNLELLKTLGPGIYLLQSGNNVIKTKL